MTARALVFVLALACCLGARAEDVRMRTGAAFDRKTGAPLYTERHEERYRDGVIVSDRVRYLAPDGALIATKEVDFTRSLIAPAFMLENVVTGHREGFVHTGDGFEVVFRKSASGKLRRKPVEAIGRAVVDAGFDRFIEAEWDRLVAGKALVRPFLIPSRLDFIDLRITCDRNAGGEGETAFRLEIDSALLRLVVPGIKVFYDSRERTLRRYEGISNLRDRNGGNFEVVIRFDPDGLADNMQAHLRRLARPLREPAHALRADLGRRKGRFQLRFPMNRP